MSLQVWIPFNGNYDNHGLSSLSADVNVPSATFANGKIGKCIQLKATGTNNISADSLIGANRFSVTCWIKLDQQNISNINNYSDFYGIGIKADTTNSLIRAEHSDKSTTPSKIQLITPRDTSTTGASNAYVSYSYDTSYKWVHTTITFDGDYVRFYIDGIKKSEVAKANVYTTSYELTGSFVIGMAGVRAYLNDFRIYDHCLSQKEVSEISKGLLMHFPMNEIDGVIGGRNFLLGSDREYTETNSEQSSTTLITGKSSLLNASQSLIGRTFTYSAEIYSPGNWEVKDSSYDDWRATRWGTHGTITWKDSTGVNANKTLYPYAEGKILSGFGVNSKSRYQSTYTINPPDGYDTLVSFNVPSSMQSYLKPTADNTATWSYGHTKLEEGNVATYWTPAPEDGAACGSDNIIYDVSGFCNNGVVTNNTCPIWDNKAVIGSGSYKFSGTNQYISGNSNLSFSDEVSFSFWMYCTDSSSNQAIFNCRSATGLGVSVFLIGGKFRFDTNGTSEQWSTTYQYPINEWVHVVITKDASNKKLYINGSLVETKADTSSIITTLGSIFSIGISSAESTIATGNTFKGNLQDFRIYATALSDIDALNLYNTRFSLADNGTLYCTEYVEPDKVFGGRNLLQNSKVTSIFKCSYGGSPTASVTLYTLPTPVIIEGEKVTQCYRVNHPVGATGDMRYTESMIMAPSGSSVNGKEFTLSAWLCSDVNTTATMYLTRNNDSDASTETISLTANTWTKIILNKKFDSSSGGTTAQRIRFTFGNVASNICIAMMKLQEGSYTPWTPYDEEYSYVSSSDDTNMNFFQSNGVLNSGLIESVNEQMKINKNYTMVREIIEN